jgi:cell division protein FtsB
MMTSIKGWLAPPVFEGDEEKTRRAWLLNATLLMVLLFVVLIILSNLLGKRTPTSTLIIDIIILAAAVLLRYYLFTGKVTFVGIGVIISGILLITMAMVSKGTIRTSTTATFLFLVIIAGILYGMKGVLVTTIVSSGAVAATILAENAGLVPRPDYTVTITQWFTYTFLFGLTGFLTYYSYQTAIASLKRSQKEVEERKRTEEALRESETRWHLPSSSGDGFGLEYPDE